MLWQFKGGVDSLIKMMLGVIFELQRKEEGAKNSVKTFIS